MCFAWGVHSVRMQVRYYKNTSLTRCLMVYYVNAIFMPICFIIAYFNDNLFYHTSPKKTSRSLA